MKWIISSHQIRKDDAILKGTGHPDQVQRVLINADLGGQATGVVTAQPCPAVGVDADAKVTHSSFQVRSTHNVGDGLGDTRVHLSGVVYRRIILVVEGDEEDVGY